MLYNNNIFRGVGNTELFPHHNKYIPPEIVSSGISALGSLVGGLFGSSSSKSAAKAQLQAVRETNKANLDLAKYQNEWNVAQWNRQNAYNTPAMQRQRYEEAGINPYFALGNIQSGNAEGLMSANMANQQPVVSDLQGQSGQILGNSISDAAHSGINAYYSAQIQQEQAKALQIENTFNLQSLRDRVNSLHYDSESKRMANYVYNHSMASLINIQKNEERMSYSREAIMNLQRVGTEYDLAAKIFTNNNILPAQASLAKMSLNQMVAQIALTKQQEKLTQKEVDYYADKMAIQWLQANSQWLTAKTGMFNAQTNRLDVNNQIWNRNQSTYRENYVFNRTKNQLVKQIKLGVDVLGRENRFGKTREHLWLDSGHFNRFFWTTGEVFNQVQPFKFGFGR